MAVGGPAYVSSNSDGDDGAPLTDYDLIGSEIEHTGLFALEGCEYLQSAVHSAARTDRGRRDSPCSWWRRAIARTAARCSSSIRLTRGTPPTMRLRECATGRSSPKMRSCISRASSRTTSCAVTSSRLRPAARSPVFSRAATRRTRSGASRERRKRCCGPGIGRYASCPRIAARGCLLRGVNTLQSVRSVSRIGNKPRTLAAGAAGTADWQSLSARRLALFIIQLHRARHALGRRGGAHPGARAGGRSAGAGVLRAAARGRRVRRAAPRAIVLSSSAIAASTRTESDAGEFQFLIGFAAARAGEFHTYRISHSA